MRNKIMKKIIAIIVIMVMTIGNMGIVGEYAITYAIDMIKTNEKNVEMKAYFKDGEEEKISIEKNIDKTEKLYIEVAVLNEGYFNGKISLEENNFKIKKVEKNISVKSNTEKEIELNQIKAGEKVIIEAEVESNIGEEISKEELNKETKVQISGKYVKSENKILSKEQTDEVEVKGEAKVRIDYKAVEGIDTEVESKIITEGEYKVGGSTKKITQLEIRSRVKGNSYPVEEETIEMNLPEGVEAEVYGREIKAVGRETSWKVENNKLTITTKNEEKDGKIIWERKVENKYIVTLKSESTIKAEEIEITEGIKPIGVEKISKKITSSKEENVEGIVKTEKEIEGEIYKGKIYTGEEREYQERTKININYAIDENDIEVAEKEGVYETEGEEKEAQIEYKESKIEKSKVIDILGENGKIEILDQNGNQIKEITKESEVNEEGKVVVTYGEGIKGITIKITKPEKQGEIEVEHKKVIKTKGYTREEIRKIKGIKEEVETKYDNKNYTNNKINRIDLKEVSSRIKVEINKETLTTEGINEGLQVRTTLLTQGEDKKLYKNGQVKVMLPEEVEEIEEAKFKLLYGNGLTLGEPRIETESGRKVLIAPLEGEQVKYSGEAVEGTVVLLEAKISLNKKTTSKERTIDVEVVNGNDEESIKENKEIKMINPNSIIMENSINGKENLELEIEAEEKEEEIGIGIINNEGSKINNVRVLGELPSDNSKNNVGIKVTRGINISTNNANKVKIYYTEKEDATEEINKAENEWKEEVTENSKKYLITINELEQGEEIKGSYGIKIPGNLGYNKTAKAGYKIKYEDTVTGGEKEAEGKEIRLSTGVGAEIEQELVAKVGGKEVKDGEEIKAGEVITYEIKVTNKGNADAEGVKVEGNVPDGTTKVTLTEVEDSDDITLVVDDEFEQNNPSTKSKKYVKSSDKKVVFENLKIKEGENIALSYTVQVDDNIEDNSDTTCEVITSYKKSNISSKIKHILKKSDVIVNLNTVQRKENTIKTGYNYDYLLEVKNNSNEEKNNIKVKINTNSLLKIKEITYIYEENSIIYNGKDEFEIEKIKAGESIKVLISTVAQDVTDNLENAEISAEVTDNNNILYRSNVITENVETVKVDMSVTTETNSNKEDNYVVAGDLIKYTINVKNTGKVDANNLMIKNKLVNYITVKTVKLNGTEIKYNDEKTFENNKSYSIISINTSLKAGNTSTIEITATVNQITSNEILKVTNKVYAYNNVYLTESEGKTLLIKNKNENVIISEPDAEKNIIKNEEKYTISGTIWFDEDGDGERTTNETQIKDVTVYLLNSKSNEIVSNTQTDDEGFYAFTNVEKGEYMVIFEYDINKYLPTKYQVEGVASSQNSDAIQSKVKINNEEKTVAITDNLILSKDISDIDLGLIKAEKFDFELNKYVSKITVNNSHETKTYSFDKSTMEKVEIAAKYLKNSNVIIEYTIEVKNTGEIPGYVQSIVDYKPNSLEFSSNLNSDWYQTGEYLYNDTLSNTEINAGETKEIKLILNKTMTESNTGLVNNTAEIAKAYNKMGINDIDSTPGNNQNKEDDMGSADVIIGVKTGAAVSYISLTISILVILACGAYWINKKVIGKNIEI